MKKEHKNTRAVHNTKQTSSKSHRQMDKENDHESNDYELSIDNRELNPFDEVPEGCLPEDRADEE